VTRYWRFNSVILTFNRTFSCYQFLHRIPIFCRIPLTSICAAFAGCARLNTPPLDHLVHFALMVRGLIIPYPIAPIGTSCTSYINFHESLNSPYDLLYNDENSMQLSEMHLITRTGNRTRDVDVIVIARS